MKPPQYLGANNTYSTWNKRRINKKYPTKTIFSKKRKSKHDTAISFPGLNSNRGFAYNFLWILLILFSALTCSYQIYDRFSFYLSRPIETRVTLVRNSSVKFPSITLCPLFNNYIPLVAMRRQKAKEKKLDHFCKVPFNNLVNDSLNISTVWDLMSLNGALIAMSVFSRSNFMKLIRGISLPSQPSFSVKRETKTVFGTCNTYSYENLVRFQSDDYSLIFAFNENLPLCDEKKTVSMFMLHNDGDIVTYKAFIQSKPYKQSTKAQYGLSAKRFKVLNRPEKPCETNQVVNECEKNCFEKALKNISLCRLPMTTDSEVLMCANQNDSLAAYVQLQQMAVDFNYLEKCNCLEICDEILYTNHFKMIDQSEQTILSFYFDDNVIEEIEEYYSYRFISFVCDLGGNLGLFLGLSIPALFQLGESIMAYSLKKIHLQ